MIFSFTACIILAKGRSHKQSEILPHSTRSPKAISIAGGPRGRKADVFALGCAYSEMYTVVCGKSLGEYENARKEEGSFAFRDCLRNGERYLRSFESTGLNDLLANQILGMMRQKVDEPDGRLTAEKVLHHLKPQPALFCVEYVRLLGFGPW